jgi:hypothetical protein
VRRIEASKVEGPGVTLDPQDIEMIAARIVALLREQQPESQPRFVDAATVAAVLGIDRDWVYAHSAELGGVRLGGEHGRLRFDLDAIRRQLAIPAPKRAPKPTRARPSKQRGCSGLDLLPYVELPSTQQSSSGRAACHRPRPDTGRSPDVPIR